MFLRETDRDQLMMIASYILLPKNYEEISQLCYSIVK